jgi:glutathione peroxidase
MLRTALLLTACLAGCHGHPDDHGHEHGPDGEHLDGSAEGSGHDGDTAHADDHDAAGSHDDDNDHDKDTAMTATSDGIYALDVTSLDGQSADLSQYVGKVALVVNVASECGYTKQYTGLQALYESHKDKGLVVLGFPSNEFGGQEPGSAEDIQAFCTSKFSVTFPLMGKCETQPGTGQSPVYSELHEQSGDVPNWNFCKYLVGKDGNVISYYPSKIAPDDAGLMKAIDKALGAPGA